MDLLGLSRMSGFKRKSRCSLGYHGYYRRRADNKFPNPLVYLIQSDSMGLRGLHSLGMAAREIRRGCSYGLWLNLLGLNPYPNTENLRSPFPSSITEIIRIGLNAQNPALCVRSTLLWTFFITLMFHVFIKKGLKCVFQPYNCLETAY